MSDTPVEAPEINMPVKPEPVTSTDIPADGGLDNSLQSTDKADVIPDPTPSDTGSPAGDSPQASEPAKPAPIKKSPFQARIDTLTAREQAAIRDRDAAQAQADLYKAMAEGKVEGKVAPTPAEIDRLVEQRAAQREIQRQSQKVITSGNAEYPDFTDRCNIVASLGAGDRPDFMQVISDPEIIPDGHKLIAQLAEKPEEASRILALPPASMSAALVRFQMENAKPSGATISRAPAPIKPIDGTARATEIPPERRTMAQEAAAFNAARAKRFAKGK